jgi:hemerythrin-like domain-containing protein
MASLDELIAAPLAADGSNRMATVEKDLIGHMHAEEKIWYPRLERELRNLIATARAEHDQVRQMFRDLKGLRMDDRWIARIGSVRLAIKGHIVKEEGPLFDAAARMFTAAELLDLGRRFEEARPKGLIGDIGTRIAEVPG